MLPLPMSSWQWAFLRLKGARVFGSEAWGQFSTQEGSENDCKLKNENCKLQIGGRTGLRRTRTRRRTRTNGEGFVRVSP